MKRFELILKQVLPYFAVFALIFVVMLFGSNHDRLGGQTLIASALSGNSFTVTDKQISETYTAATIASTVSLPSTATITENYVTINAIYEATGKTSTTGTVIDKPLVIVIDIKRGVVVYTVETSGESITDILAKNKISGVTEEQVRHSNNLKKNATLSAGQKLYLPTKSGIVYVVKDGDNFHGIAEKYQSNYDEMILLNDLEGVECKGGMVLLLPGGKLPEKESPDYVAPRPVVPTYNPGSNRYTGVSDYGQRHGLFQVQSYAYWRDMYYATKSWNNPGAFGNCTWFAWYWRRANMPSNYWLPTGAIGNARSWASTMAARGFVVNKEPAYGAVIQTSSGGYGHVGVVVGVNPGVSITIQEMNYAGPNGKYNIVYQSNLDWGYALTFNYIHARR